MNKQGKNGIEWCDYTWSPVTGCLHGCEYCYARRIANRFSPDADKVKAAAHYCGIGKGRLYDIKEPWAYDDKTLVYPFGFDPTFHRYRLDEPQKLKKPSKIFVCSMADLFGAWVPDEWIREVFAACEAAPQHRYLFLTKNPARYLDLQFKIPLPTSYKCWYGTTVNCFDDFRLGNRAHYLSNLLGYKKFLSIEPLLGDIGELGLANLYRFDWVIIGQQTNPDKPPKDEWVQSTIDQCRAVDVPVFVKSPLYEKFPIQEWPEGLK